VRLQGYRSTKVALLQSLIHSLALQRPAQHWETTGKNLVSSERVTTESELIFGYPHTSNTLPHWSQSAGIVLMIFVCLLLCL